MKDKDGQLKIDVYDSILVRATLSDAICVYLAESKAFKTNHWLSNLKLLLGAICCLCALVAQFYPKPFPHNYWVLVVTASIYFVLSGFLHYVVTYVWEGDLIYTGESKEYGKVTVRASMPKYCETYTFSIGPASAGKNSGERASKTASIGAYFDTNGVLVKEALEADVDAVLAQFKAKAKPKGGGSSSSSSESESGASNKKSKTK